MRRLVCLRSRGQRGQEVRGQGSEVIPRWQVVVLMGRLCVRRSCSIRRQLCAGPAEAAFGPLAGLACALRSIVFFAEEASPIVAAQLVPR